MDTTDANNNNGNFESICGISTFPSGRGLSGKSNQLEVHHPSPGRGWRALSGALGSLNTTECNSHSRVQTGSKGKAPCLRALFMPKSELEGRNKTLQIFFLPEIQTPRWRGIFHCILGGSVCFQGLPGKPEQSSQEDKSHYFSGKYSLE